MNPIPILPATTLAAALAALALATNPASAGVVLSESFEAPVVTGFVQATVPSNGNWIGAADGYGAGNRGLYNETVVWPATPPFTTPYGKQAYYLNYTNSGLATAEGKIGVLTADVTYQVTFNTAVAAGTGSGGYLVELVAFSPGDVRTDFNGTMPGTVLASATGTVTTSDMSATGSLTFTPAIGNAHLGKDVGIRLVKSTNSVLYDNIRLITGHDLNPQPASGQDLSAGGNVTLSWTNMPPTGASTYVDVWFGTTPAALTQQLVDGQITSSTVASAPQAGTYYWRVDSYPDGNPNGTPVIGDVFSFTISDTDGDGLPDEYELAHTSPPSNTALNPTSDLDSDNLTAAQEYTYGTDPNDNDTDNDGLLDGPELTGVGLRPPTSPLDSDSDDDGLSDGVESNTGTWVSSANTGTNPKDNDWDKDGLLDGAENKTATVVDKNNAGTDPYDTDTDNDGVGDYYEVVACFTSPFNANDKPAVPYPLPNPDSSTGATNKPVKVYIMSGQSNMVGMGFVNGTGDDTLETMTRRQNRFPNLIDGAGAWTSRQDVRYRGVISAIGNGPLAPGFGADTNKIGPELGFGQIMGWYHDEAVLCLKSSIGNRSLGWDVLPPNSPSYQYGGLNYAGYGDASLSWAIGSSPAPWTTGSWYAGYEWDRYFTDESQWVHPHAAEINVVDILDNWVAEYSGAGKPYAGRDFQIAGFVWWQGDKDRYDMGHATRYEQNLVNLITSLRSYYSNRYPGKVANNAPFVLGTLGQTAIGDTTPQGDVEILNAQLAMNDTVKYPQFAGNVKTVYTHPLSEGGASNSHYNNRAGTYMLVGDALGRAMHEMQLASTGPDTSPPVLISLSPANGASAVSTGTNLVANFNESIAIGTGDITIHYDDVVLSIAVTDATQVSVSGATLTINPTANLDPNKQYAIQIAATAIDDLAGNSYAGITDNTTWSFTTASPDLTAPTLSSTNPVNGASGVQVNSNLVATFSEPIAIGTGNITLHPTDSSGDVVIPVTAAAQVSVSGSVLTINPTADLVLGKTYAIRIDATAIDDLAGNSYAGISNDVTWSFSTPAPPPVGLLFTEDFESPVVTGYSQGSTPPTKWVRAAQGYMSSAHGLINEVVDGLGTGIEDPAGAQAYAFRYTNSGLTSAAGKIGALQTGVTYTVNVDVSKDIGETNGTAYLLQLIAFAPGAARDNCTTTPAGSVVLNSASGNSTTDFAYSTVTLTFTANATHAAVLGYDLGVRFIGGFDTANIDNVSVSTTGIGPGPVDHFAISAISSPRTVGTPITGITITAQDVSNQTATSFTGTVTFGGTGGFTGTSASFTAGVLTGVSVTPTAAGSNLTFTVSDAVSGKTGSTTIATIQTQYQAWAVGGVAFDADSNGDGVKNGLAWVLGAANPSENALNKLPVASRNGGNLRLAFRCLKSTKRGTAQLKVQSSSDCGASDPWTSHEAAVPDADGTVNGVVFDTTDDGDYINVIADIPAAGAKLFARLQSSP